MELQLIKNNGVPKGEPITQYALMTKVLCVIEGEGARVLSVQNVKLQNNEILLPKISSFSDVKN